MNVREEIKALEDELISLRRDIHSHPELGFEEHRTSKVVKDYLSDLGLEVKAGFAHTGVTGLLRGSRSGKTIMLRADMDALPINEETGLPYASENKGVMHACGHDGHVAMLLVAAKILTSHKDEIRGNVLFLFQPNEEIAGAKQMIDDGALKPKPDAGIALHLWTPLESGTIGFSTEGVMAGMDEFHITIKGKGGHTGAPHLSIDPVLTAAEVIQSVQSMQTREIDPLSSTVVVFGQVNGGVACNAIPSEVKLDGTIRYLYRNDPSGQERPLERFERIVRGICSVHGAECDLNFVYSNGTVYNDEGLYSQLRPVVESIVPSDKILQYRAMAGEDFSEYGDHMPCLFVFIGAGNEHKNCHYPHHHPRFDIDEDVLKTGVEFHVKSVMNFLKD